MTVYGIIIQSEDDIRCYAVFNSIKKRDLVLEYLTKKEEGGSTWFYAFNEEIITTSLNTIKQSLKRREEELSNGDYKRYEVE